MKIKSYSRLSLLALTLAIAAWLSFFAVKVFAPFIRSGDHVRVTFSDGALKLESAFRVYSIESLGLMILLLLAAFTLVSGYILLRTPTTATR